MARPWKPTKEQLLAAESKTVRDVIAPDLNVLFCGINPGLYTAAVGHHFARPGVRDAVSRERPGRDRPAERDRRGGAADPREDRLPEPA